MDWNTLLIYALLIGFVYVLLKSNSSPENDGIK